MCKEVADDQPEVHLSPEEVKKPQKIPGTVPACRPIFKLRTLYIQTRPTEHSSATLNGRIILKRIIENYLVIFDDSN